MQQPQSTNCALNYFVKLFSLAFEINGKYENETFLNGHLVLILQQQTHCLFMTYKIKFHQKRKSYSVYFSALQMFGVIDDVVLSHFKVKEITGFYIKIFRFFYGTTVYFEI